MGWEFGTRSYNKCPQGLEAVVGFLFYIVKGHQPVNMGSLLERFFLYLDTTIARVTDDARGMMEHWEATGGLCHERVRKVWVAGPNHTRQQYIIILYISQTSGIFNRAMCCCETTFNLESGKHTPLTDDMDSDAFN